MFATALSRFEYVTAVINVTDNEIMFYIMPTSATAQFATSAIEI